MIFDKEPADWIDLQNLVAQLFNELGCDVTVGKPLDLVRGSKEIDVLVIDAFTSPPSRYLCECKFWRKPIPQEVIHAFRTVVADSGAHRGFIISRAGFQRGAHESVEKTNVDLVTFSELQTMFFDRWKVAMGNRYMPYADRLFRYWDPVGGKIPKRKWDERDVAKLHRLNEAYEPLVKLGPTLKWKNFVWQLPMSVPALDGDGNLCGTTTLRSYRELYDFIEQKKDIALKDYQVLYGEVNP